MYNDHFLNDDSIHNKLTLIRPTATKDKKGIKRVFIETYYITNFLSDAMKNTIISRKLQKYIHALKNEIDKWEINKKIYAR